MVKKLIAVPFLVICLSTTNLFAAEETNAQGPASPAEPEVSGTVPAEMPVGSGTNWQTEVETDSAEKVESSPAENIDRLSAEDVELIRQVSDYFNQINDLQGTFVQTSSANERSKGRFYVKRPGRLRFDYAAPSKLRIVSDGEWLTIEDLEDIQNTQRYSLDSTPFRMLLRKDVDLLRDANILDVSRGEDVVILTLTDKKDGSSGQIRLFFTIPEFMLKEWIITDPQGLDTRVEIANLDLDKTINPEIFEPSEFKLPEFQN